jgi:tellurite resistance protein
MVSTSPSPYTDTQITTWLRGLLTIAWADGDFDPDEQAFITQLTERVLAPSSDLGAPEPISPADLAAGLGPHSNIAENFLRTAVMVAIADGVYSTPEDEIIQQFCTALGHTPKSLEALRLTMNTEVGSPASGIANSEKHGALLHPVQEWLDHLEVSDPRLARFLCKLIPSQCPFERDVTLFGGKVVHIPPMCKLNPLYDQLVGLRFRALSYLADVCREDVSKYC